MQSECVSSLQQNFKLTGWVQADDAMSSLREVTAEKEELQAKAKEREVSGSSRQRH